MAQLRKKLSNSILLLILRTLMHPVAYYLNHRDEVDAYLRERRTQREQIRREVEARFDPQGIRDRLVARRDKK